MYSFNLENIVPLGGLACLIAKATTDESNIWHRRLGHVNFKNLNRLVKGNLVRGLPTKLFQNDQTCVACQKGKQHKAFCKAKLVSSISQPSQLLHMDLFGPTSVQKTKIDARDSEMKMICSDCFELPIRKIAKGETSVQRDPLFDVMPEDNIDHMETESSVQRDPLFDVMPEDNIDHMETDNAQSEGRTREMVDEDKEIDEVRLSTEDAVSTDKEGVSTDFEKVSTDFEKVSTDKPKVSTDGSKVSTDEQIEGADDQVEGTEEIFESTEEQRPGTEEKVESTAGQIEGTEDQTKEEIATQASQTSTQTPTSMIFGDDETIATLLLNMSKAKAVSKEKEKGVELKDVEEIDRPRPTSQRSLLTLKPLPKINPKDKGKRRLKRLRNLKEAEEERNRLAKEEATNEALIKNFDDIKARIEADRILTEKLQEQEREQFTIEERAKFLHDTIAAQRKFLAQQRSEAIRNRPPTKKQLRN
ncbi:putative ribonuclease H-like domain-containing protein [Tanacetum coccineum]